MKIGIAQIAALKGEVDKNINNHLLLIKRAINLGADVIIFPELSITGYEPELAKALATHIDDSIFNRFQELSDQNNSIIGIGMPTKSIKGIHISMLIFQPYKKRMVYAKQILHADEKPYFVCGNKQTYIHIKGNKIAIGICYEALQPKHVLKAIDDNANLYIASVAKSKEGIEKANAYFPRIAKEYKIPILMSNAIGYCDNFLSAGQSAVWNKNGKLMAQLDHKNQGLLIYDTELEAVEMQQSKIEKGQSSELDTIFQMYLNAKHQLEQNGIYQWTTNYPTLSILQEDLKKGVLYTLQLQNEIIGAINISEEQEDEYQSINWQYNDSKVLVIHRLVIDPKHQQQGYAKQLMDFAEDVAIQNKYTSIRLDVYSQNINAINFYKKREYFSRGEVNFPERAYPFHCMEKEIKPS